ncbi:MAG: RluA family pseudouridine synthase [Verrucomicrobiota bacterium]
MAKPRTIPLPDDTEMAILYEDRGVLAIDKPAGWMLGPDDEEHCRRNLQLFLELALHHGEWWAKSRNLKFLRFIHRLDAPTSGVMLLSRSAGALAQFSQLFADRLVEKRYLAVTEGLPRAKEWECREPLGPAPGRPGRHRVEAREGKPAETVFRVLDVRGQRALVEARPLTGRTHQIRLHLQAAGCPVVGDDLYGRRDPAGLALRAVEIAYRDPFTRRPVRIRAPEQAFRERFGFAEPLPATPATPSPPPPAPPPLASPTPRPPARPSPPPATRRPGMPGLSRPA